MSAFRRLLPRRMAPTLRIAVGLVLGGLLLLEPNAYAEGGKGKVRIKKKTRLSTMKNAQGDDYNAQKETLLAQKRGALMFDIKRFLSVARDSDQKGELNLRLAGLYMEEYQSNLAKAQDAFDKANVAYAEKKDKDKKLAPPKFDTTEATASLDRARAIYRDLMKQYPEHARRDEMIFFMAQASLDRGLQEEAMNYFKQLLQEAPQSRYSNDAIVQLGDNYFEKNQYEQAEVYFDEVIKRNFTPLVAYARYKKAWCTFNTSRIQESVTHFKWVVENEDLIENASVRVKNEAIKDISLPFSELGMVDEAASFFRALGDYHYRKGCEGMAGLYAEKGNLKNATFFYETLLGMDASHPKNPEYDIAIAEAMWSSKEQKAAVERIIMRFPTYAQRSNWYEVNAQDVKVVKLAHEKFEETMRKYALSLHAEGQKTKNPELYASAKHLYSKYIEYFPKTPHTSKIRFYLAEIQYKQNEFLPAADNYYLVFQDEVAGAPMRLDSIRYSLKSLDQELNRERKDKGLDTIGTKSTKKLTQKVDEDLKQTPYNEAETKFVSIASVYLEKYPKQKDAPDVLYEQAYIRYTHFDFADSYVGFWKLVQEYEKHELARPSSYLILDILNRRKDYPKLVAACKKFLEMPQFKKEVAFRTEVADILRKAELKRIAMVEDKGEFKQAGDMYVEYTKAYGQQDEVLFEKALYNASINYRKAGALVTAVETQEQFLRRFPKSEHKREMILQVAKTYETLANFEKAAAYFELFATSYPQHEQSKNALRLAGLYHWGSGNPRRGEAAMLLYLKQYPNDTDQVDDDLLALYENIGDVQKQLGFYNMLRSRKGVHPAMYVHYTIKIAELYEKNGADKFQILGDAMKAVQRSGKAVLEKPEGVEAVSKMRLWYAEQKLDYMVSLKLALPQQQLEATLSKKLQLLKDLEAEYMAIAGLGNAEFGLASIYKIATVYRHLAEAILAAPVPTELTGEQMEFYRGEIHKQFIKPMTEKANNLASQCIEKAQEFNVLSQWNARCYGLASELNPDRYAPARTLYLDSFQLALLLPGKPKDPNVQPPTPMGTVKFFLYPFYTTRLFRSTEEEKEDDKADASNLPELEGKAPAEGGGIVPQRATYAALGEERKRLLKQALEQAKPADYRKPNTFAYLNLLRLSQPQKAIPLILKAIEKEPESEALHNLLGLAYYEADNLGAARVTWLAMVAREVKHAAIWNNLAVVALREGNEDMALALWREAIGMPDAREAMVNYGFSALKFRNGFEAKRNFEKALSIEPNDAASQVGLEVARVQNRETDSARSRLADLAKRLKRDPYARLSIAYVLLDVEKDPELARQLLAEWVEGQTTEPDTLFRQAMAQARHAVRAQAEKDGEGEGGFGDERNKNRQPSSSQMDDGADGGSGALPSIE